MAEIIDVGATNKEHLSQVRKFIFILIDMIVKN